MRKIVFCLLLLLPNLLQAQLLYEIRGNGLRQPSYLFGTVHLPDSRLYPLPGPLAKRLAAAEAYAGELRVEEGMAAAVMQHAFMPADTTLADLLAPEQYEWVQRQLQKKLGMAAGFAEQLKPVFVGVLLAQQPTEAAAPQQPQQPLLPLDLYLQQQAEQQQKPLFGLETLEQQLAAFDSISLKVQAEMLYTDLQETSLADSREQLMQLYLAQNTDSLYRLTTEGLAGNAAYFLLEQRNLNMLPKLERLIRQQPTFVAVGAAHLPGPTGLVQLLIRQGYRLKAISY
jgi:uncharacterized protein YbaP (TraB family)